MPLPNLIHPVNIEWEPLQRAQTIVDDDFREPIQQGNRSVRYNVPGQVNWKTGDDMANPRNFGSESEADGYILFRWVDLEAAGAPIPKQGDRVIATGSGNRRYVVDVYVIRVQPMGHYPDQRGPSLFRAWFKDRSPSKQNRGGV